MSILGGDLVALVTGGVLKIDGGGGTCPVPPVLSATQTSLDKKLLKAVEKILNKLGKVLIYKVYANETYDEVTSERTLGSATDFYKKSIPPFKAEQKLIDGDVVQSDDMFTGIAGKDLDFTPELTQEVVLGSLTYKVVRMVPVYSGERICLYLFQLRQ